MTQTLNATLETQSDHSIRAGYRSFLAVDGERVAWLSYRLEDGEVIIRTIEVRAGHQRQGHARRIVEMVVSHHGANAAYHTGGFTPEGYNLRHLFVRPEHAGPARIEYSSMTFICDWGTGAMCTNRCLHSLIDDED